MIQPHVYPSKHGNSRLMACISSGCCSLMADQDSKGEIMTHNTSTCKHASLAQTCIVGLHPYCLSDFDNELPWLLYWCSTSSLEAMPNSISQAGLHIAEFSAVLRHNHTEGITDCSMRTSFSVTSSGLKWCHG